MAYPAGVITRPVTFGPAFELEDGDVAGMQVTFKATRPGVLWLETGQPAVSTQIVKTADDGVEQVVYLPVTDQDGWGDGDGNLIVPGADGHVFLYIVTVIFTQNGRTIPGAQPRSKVVPIPQGDLTPLDLDKLIPLTTPGGTVVSVPDIWSEQIAAAEAAAIAAAASMIDSDTFMASKADDPTSEFAASLSAKIATQVGGETQPFPARFSRLAMGGHHAVPRQPVGFGVTFDGSTFTSDAAVNKTLFPFTAVIKGGFSREAGWGALDPGFVFGQNNFITTGKTAGDLDGLNDIYGSLLEVHDFTPGSHLNYLIGAASEATLKATGAVVENVIGFKVRGSRIRGGTATNAYGLYIDSPVTEETGVITGLRRALHVSGTADSYFGGDVLLNDRKLDAGAGAGALVRARNIIASADPTKNAQAAITAYALDATGVGLIVAGAVSQTADLQRWQDAGGVIKAKVAPNGVATFALIKAGGLDNTDGAGVKVTQSTATDAGLRVQAFANPTANLTSWLTSTNGELFGITASGAPRWTATALAQTTVGAAGAASAPPATPAKYLKVVDATGTTLVIPAYAAA